MATSVLIQDDEDAVEIPFLRSLDEFRAWAVSDEFPKRGRIDFISGRIEVDMAAEEIYSHGTLKTRLVTILGQIVDVEDLGYLFTDSTRISSPEGDLSAEPDLVFASYDSVASGRVRRIASASGRPEEYVELEGAVDLVVEIVSDSSVAKDTQRLPVSYYRAGIREYWLFDVRRDRLVFELYRPGPNAYETEGPDAEGFLYSVVFDRLFRLTRGRDRLGAWKYDLLHKRKGS